jgi:ankyrin repeat protein
MFLQAATVGNISVLDACITSGMDVNIVADDKSSALHCAARSGHSSAVQYLLNTGADREARNEKHRTPLHEAVISRIPDTVNLLIKSGAQLYSSKVTVDTLGQSGSQEILKLCLSHLGERIPHDMMYKILCAASRDGQILTVAAILSLFQHHVNDVETSDGANERAAWETRSQRPDIPGASESTDLLQYTPLHFATAEGHLEIIQLLLKHQPTININYRQTTPLHVAVRAGHTNVVEFMLSLPDIQVNSADYKDLTPLHLSAQRGSLEIVGLLLKHAGIDIHSRNYLEQTPLHLAASSGHVEVVELLLKHPRIDINPGDFRQITPLHLAASSGHVEVVKLLLEQAGIDINSRDSSQSTPSHLAASLGHVEVVKLLLQQAGIDINSRDSGQSTPLYLAACSGQVKVVTLLLQQDGVDTRCYDSRQLSALQIAGLRGHYNVAQVLLDHEEMLEINDMTIPPLAREYLPPCEVMERLLRHPDFRDVNLLDTADYWGYGLLHTAVRKGECDVIRVLLNHKDIDVNLRPSGYSKKTPLLLATELGQPDAVKLLLQHQNIDMNLHVSSWFRDIGHKDLTPLQLAKEEGFSEIVDLLVAKGAEDYESPLLLPSNNHDAVPDPRTYKSQVANPAVFYDEVDDYSFLDYYEVGRTEDEVEASNREYIPWLDTVLQSNSTT